MAAAVTRTVALAVTSMWLLALGGVYAGLPPIETLQVLALVICLYVQVARLCQYMGHMHTNNQAEYAGLIAGLQVCPIASAAAEQYGQGVWS